MDITVDAEMDMPQDILKFQTDWKDALEVCDLNILFQFGVGIRITGSSGQVA